MCAVALVMSVLRFQFLSEKTRNKMVASKTSGALFMRAIVEPFQAGHRTFGFSLMKQFVLTYMFVLPGTQKLPEK